MPPALGHVLSLLGTIPKGAGDVGDTNPKFLPLFPQEAAARGWGHIPEQPKLFQLLFRFIWAGGGRESWAPGSIRNNSLELIGCQWIKPRTQPAAIQSTGGTEQSMPPDSSPEVLHQSLCLPFVTISRFPAIYS